MSTALDRNLECYRNRQVVEVDLDERDFEKDPKCSDAPKEIVDAAAGIVYTFNILGFLENFPKPIKYDADNVKIFFLFCQYV